MRVIRVAVSFGRSESLALHRRPRPAVPPWCPPFQQPGPDCSGWLGSWRRRDLHHEALALHVRGIRGKLRVFQDDTVAAGSLHQTARQRLLVTIAFRLIGRFEEPPLGEPRPEGQAPVPKSPAQPPTFRRAPRSRIPQQYCVSSEHPLVFIRALPWERRPDESEIFEQASSAVAVSSRADRPDCYGFFGMIVNFFQPPWVGRARALRSCCRWRSGCVSGDRWRRPGPGFCSSGSEPWGPLTAYSVCALGESFHDAGHLGSGVPHRERQRQQQCLAPPHFYHAVTA